MTPPADTLSPLRRRVGEWIEAPRMQRLILGLIFVNAAILGLETSPRVMALAGPALMAADQAILAVFVVEILAKLYAHRGGFFRQPWNVFDLVVVGIALVPASGPLSVLRTLRVLRVLRLVSGMPRLRFVVESLLHAIPSIGAIAGLLGILYYVFAVMATGLFGERFPDWFGSVGASLYTLFQIMTLESWSMGIVRPVMQVYPYAWAFFVPFILLATFTMLNLFIAVIVNTMQALNDEHPHEERARIEAAVHDEAKGLERELRALRAEVGELKAMLARAQKPQ
ncbi:MAG: ion transporter [Burkholderiales bacterium]